MIQNSTKKRTILLVIAITAVGVVVTLSRGQATPSYHGKGLSYWLANAQDQDALEKALGHMGTNAIPALLRRLEAPENGFREYLVRLLNEQPVKVLRLKSARASHFEALAGICALRSNAAPAIPALSNMLHRGQARIDVSMC